MNKDKENTAVVVLARKADEETAQKIAAFVQSRGYTKIRYEIDRRIVGGLVVYMGDEIYDGSVRGRLEQIRQSV